jgi:hypothetical protein
MTQEREVFEHGAGFEQGELSGTVRLDRFEAHYEELFAEVIEDGVITAEERLRLDKAAQAMGLDPTRLSQLERAMAAIYELRHRTTIVDATAGFAKDDEPRASLQVVPPSSDPRTKALERRVAELEARVRELEAELEAARAQAAVEVDVSGLGAGPTKPGGGDDPAELRRVLRHDPRDEAALHGLYRACLDAGDVDGAYTTAHVLVFLGLADADEAKTFREHRVEGLLRPAASLGADAWRRFLMHPDEEPLVGEIFATVVSAVTLGRVAALRAQKLLPQLDPSSKHDAKTSTVQAVRCFGWAAAILGMPAPALYTAPDRPHLVELVPGVPPASRLGKAALSGRTPGELAFVAGRHLAWYREEHFVRLLVPGVQDLEDIFLAALAIGNPGLPLGADVKARVAPLARALEPVLEPPQVDRLRGSFLRFVEEGGRTNLARWAAAADKTAARAGFLLVDNLADAEAMLKLERAGDAAALVDDLLAFATSERYGKLRKQIGVAVG